MMKTNALKRRLLTALLSLCMIVPLFGGMIAFAEDETGPMDPSIPPTPSIAITIAGEPYPPPEGERVTYHEGDPVSVTLEWKLDQDGYRFAGDSFTYDLGDILVDPNKRSGVLYDNGEPIGTYTVDENNQLIVKLNEDYTGRLNRDVVVTLNGIIPTDQTYDPEGEDKEVRIGEETVTVQPVYNDSTIGLAKRVSGSGNVTLDESGNYVVEFEIEVMIGGNARDIVINDVLGDGLYLPNNDISGLIDLQFEFNDTLEHNEYGHVNYDKDDNQVVFSFDGEYHKDDKIIIRYKAYVTEEKMAEMVKDGSTVRNTADGTFTNNKGAQNQPIPEDDAEAGVIPPRLSKRGAWIDDETIVWTITFQTGSMGYLGENLSDVERNWEQLGLDRIVDSLGEGLTLADGGSLNLKDLIAGFEFTSGPDANGSCVYTLTLQTTVDGSRLTYSNGVSSSFFGQEFGADAGVGPEGSVSKAADGVNDDGTISWTVTVKLPDDPGTLNSFVIREMPDIPYDEYNKNEDGEAYADLWQHRVIAETVMINDLAPKEAGADVKTNRNNVSIEFDVNSPFFRDHAGETITITLKTEIVDTDGNRVNGAFDDSYHYTNTVHELIDGTMVGRDEAGVEDKDADSIIDKNYEGVTDSDVLWYIEIAEDFFSGHGYQNLTGILAGNGTFDLVLKDTLPEGMVYVKNNAYVELNLSDQGMEPEEEPVNLDELYALLSKALVVTPIDDKNVEIRWTMDETLRSQIKNFPLTDVNGKSMPLFQGKVASDGEEVWADHWAHIKLRIYYSTTLSSMDYEDLENGKTFTNTVDGTVNGTPAGRDTASVELQRSKALIKSYDYHEDTRKAWSQRPDFKDYYGKYSVSTGGVYNIYYQVDINPQRLSFGKPGEDDSWITLKDEMGEGISLVFGSIRVTDLDADPQRVLDDSEYDLTVHVSDNSFQISLPDSTHFMLEYFAKIEKMGAGGEIEDAWNNVELLGGWNESSSVDIWDGVALQPDGFARSGDSFDIYKYYTDSNGDSRTLSGATFQLTAYSGYDSEKKEFIPITEEQNAQDFPNVRWIQTSDPTVSFSSLHRNYIYLLEEIQAPDGYKKSNKAYYFIFEDYYADGGEITSKAELQALGVIEIPTSGYVFYVENELDGNLLVTKTAAGGDPSEAFRFTVTLTEAGGGPAYTGAFDAIQVIRDGGEWRALVDAVKVRTNDKGILLDIYNNPVRVNDHYEPMPNGATDAEAAQYPYYVYVGGTRDGALHTHTVFQYEEDGDSLTETFPDGRLTVTAYLVPVSVYDEAESAEGGSGWNYPDRVIGPNDDFVVGTMDMENSLGHKVALRYNGSTAFKTTTVTFDQNGEATFYLKNGEGLLFNTGDNVVYTVTETLTKEQLGAGWEFVEVDGTHTSGVTVGNTSDGGETRTVTGMTDTGRVTDFEHYYNQNSDGEVTGNLEVSKRVSGPGANTAQRFTFTVKLSDTTINGTYGRMTFTNGVAEFTLKHGELCRAEGLPVGVAYTVSELEANLNEYVTTAEGEIGVIASNGTAKATFTNTRDGKLPDIPMTGDDMNLTLWTGMMLICAAALALSLRCKKRER